MFYSDETDFIKIYHQERGDKGKKYFFITL